MNERLARTYQELHRNAQRTGEDRRVELSGGIRLAVRVRDSTTTLTIARKNGHVAASDIESYRQACGVPDDAQRLPEAGQEPRADGIGNTYYCIGYRWKETGHDHGHTNTQEDSAADTHTA